MNELIGTICSLDQDQAVVALFAALLVLAFGVFSVAAILRSAGKWGTVALFLAVAGIVITLRSGG